MNPYLSATLLNLVTAVVWILLGGLLPEPWRQRSQAGIVAMAAGAYLTGPFGAWEMPMALVAVTFAVIGITRYWGIAAAWLAHTTIDLIHQFGAPPIAPELPYASFGCAVLDAALAIWFFAGAPSWIQAVRRRPLASA